MKLFVLFLFTFVCCAAGGVIGLDANSSGCGGPRDLQDTSGFIFSHKDFGNANYPSDANCTWRILGRSNKVIRLRFVSFNIETGSGCYYDFFNIYDGNNSSAKKYGPYCGSSVPHEFISSGQTLFLTFESDNEFQEKGFKLQYDVIEPANCGPDQFRCWNSKCTSLDNRCDGVDNCGDKSDELGCLSNNCGVPEIPPIEQKTRIVGGREAKPNSWPWQSQLFYKQYHFCGASLISDRWLVTAAHCTFGRSGTNLWKFTLGSHRTALTDPFEIKVDAERIVNHPQYNDETNDYDIALIKLTRRVNFTAQISPICLARKPMPDDTMCFSTGFGDTRNTGSRGLLKQAAVPLVNQALCNSSDYYSGHITPRMLCAGYEEGGHDACQGDSGGPLVCKTSSKKWELQGVISWGSGCAGAMKPGVYARVTELYHWIVNVIAVNSVI